MKVIHQIVNNWSKEDVNYLFEHGIEIEEGVDSFIIDENETYEQIKNYLSKVDALDWKGSEFTKAEIKNSEYTQIFPSWDNGYPQPENEYLETFFDLSNYCSECGIGVKQIKPFHIKKEPKWTKRKRFFSLHWVASEIFIEKELYLKIFKPLGIDYWDVYLHSTNKKSLTTVQLKIPELKEDILHGMDSYNCEICSSCGRKKYLPIILGFFPKLKKEISLPIFKTNEYMGSGHAADNWLIINKELKQTLLSEKSNLIYYPLES